MSSSVFLESNPQDADNASTSDSNLVVVYGKNGVSFDDKGLENLIEDKKISSISVVRLTSPTPSMRDEEEETEKLEEMLRRQEIVSDKESNDSEKEDDDTNKEESSGISESSNDDDVEGNSLNESEDSSEESKSRQRRLPRRRGRQPNAAKHKKSFRRRRRDRPEIVGLHLEEFYPAEDANAIIKEALKIAGLKSDKKSRSDYEFQMFVIHNDHCYTPFTSPAQMKAKLAADRIEAQKLAANRKITVLQTSSGKQLFIRRKIQQGIQSKPDNASKLNLPSTSLARDKSAVVSQKPKKDVKDNKTISENIIKEDNDIVLSLDENEEDTEDDDGSEVYVSEGSAETDNDRDSDLDFDVNNPKGRKRKVKLLRAQKRTPNVNKLNPKIKRSGNQDDYIESPNKTIVAPTAAPNPVANIPQRQKSIVKIIPDPNRIIRSTPTKIVRMIGKSSGLSPVIAALPPIPKKQSEHKPLLNTSGIPSPANLQSKTIVLVKGTQDNKTSAQTSPQTHKEIVINKQVMSSPKTKGFTDLTKLIEQTEKQTPVKVYGLPTTPKSSHTATITSVVTFSPRSAATGALKGFMPLETAAKNQLPAQISIQTHQSSSELEAEHDKQLDLINSIVQDEMQKTNEKSDEQISNINENIPELVKMLESTEKVLESSKVQQTRSSGGRGDISQNIINLPSMTTSSANNLVGDIDITSASLLATPEGDGNEADDLPDDILQQVVDLIKDDRTLQEAVEKQVFGSSVCSEREMANNMVSHQNPPPLAPISQQPIRIQENPQTLSKSIIQLAISNVPTSPPSTTLNPVTTTRTAITTPTTVTPTTMGQISKTSPLVRKEPIQIVRGNGRVITLPPIEAPTTRAKRRAQAQPNPNTTGNISFASNATLNESSLDSSVHSNSSLTMGSSNSVATIQEKKLAEASSRRRGSKENITAVPATSNQKVVKAQKTVAKKAGNKSNTTKGKVETEATASEGDDDDDPNKLWCICRQPHNNRFMICCDVCEDWFHGTCVSITKAMGLEMEQKGIDWTCPKCTKKQEEKKQPKITEMLVRKTSESISAQSDPIVVSTSSTPALVASGLEQKPVTPKATGNIEVISMTAKKEAVPQNLDISPHLKLQSGQIINLKDFNTTSAKRATIIQTSTSNTTPVTAGQKKIFVASGQANLKLTSQPGTPIRTITVVKQLTTPQQHHNQNIKIIKTYSSASSTSGSQSVNTSTTSVLSSPSVSVSSSTSTPSSSIATECTTLCIVCKKIARSNSIYCSDDCIRKHAQNALNSLMNKSQTDTSGTSSPSNKSVTEEKAKKKSKGLFEELLSAADRKPKVERVNVYERKSGRVITGSSAPTASNLKKWLQDNPTFEVIQPGSTQAVDLEKKHKLRSEHSSSPTTSKSAASSPPPLKMFSSTISSATANKIDSNVAFSPSHGHSHQVHANKAVRNITDYLKPAHSLPASPRPGTPKQLHKYPQHVAIKPDKVAKTAEESKSTTKEKTSATKRQTSTEGSSKSSNNDGEPIRLVVRRTLKEQLLLRIKEETSCSTSTDQNEGTSNLNNFRKLTEEEVEEFAKATELEMYNYFNKDTGTRYKSKYRSLVFNIKDRKNHTLFAKICGKLIEPKQLVRMSPEELASQELAQWREQENKHQLEMIKKSELDLLSCAKNYVLKTHKGEEVIEGKSSDYANVDITIPVEDVVSAINKSDLPDTGAVMRKESQTHWSDSDSTFLSHSHSLLLDTSHSLIEDDKPKVASGQVKEKDKEREKDRSRGRDREKERERDKRRKSKDRHHDKLRSRKRSRSHSRSRSRERTEKRHKSSSHRDEKRERDERSRADKERSKDRSDREHSDTSERKLSSEMKKSNVTQPKQPSKKVHEQHKSTINPMETYNLIDQILESTKTVEEAANLISDKDKEKDSETQRKSSITPQPVQLATSTVSACSSSSADSAVVVDITNSMSTTESDQEPTSTVSIPTPPHDPYSRFIACSSPSSFSGDMQYTIISLWTGNINMVDVTSFQLSIQPILGNSTGLAKLLPKELDVVGRIGPETVWDYISKIKKSPNKEIVVIRLIPANESETVAYKILYEYLDNRSRLGVIKSINSQIKDFYIYPLGAGKRVPSQLQRSEPVEFYDDPVRPDVLIGIIVRVVGSKRSVSSSQANTSGAVNKLSRTSIETDHFTPPGSPKAKRHRQLHTAHKVGDIDIDAIIKAPIVAKSQKKVVAAPVSKSHRNDADEPYSPGGSSDDDMPLLPVKLSGSIDQMQTSEDELKRKMEEINRQIAAQEMEIAGLLTGEQTTFGSATASTSNVLANISIPSNLSQILASIKTTGKDNSAVPPPPPRIGSLLKPSAPLPLDSAQEFNPNHSMGAAYDTKDTSSGSNSTSLLAKLSEAELLSMVPDDIVITPSKPTRFEEPPPPGV